jgi:hypothetical protein
MLTNADECWQAGGDRAPHNDIEDAARGKRGRWVGGRDRERVTGIYIYIYIYYVCVYIYTRQRGAQYYLYIYIYIYIYIEEGQVGWEG